MKAFAILTIGCIIFFASASLGWAQAISFPDGKIISKIEISGLENVDENNIKKVIQSKEGQVIRASIVAADIKNIYRLGIADNIIIEYENLPNNRLALVYLITEKPRIRKVIFSGNNRIKDSELLKNMKSKQFALINSEIIAQDINSIKRSYEKEKVNDVKILYSLVKVNKTTADLLFQIFENPRTYVTEINVTGVEYFYPLNIKRQIISHKIDCFSWLTSKGIFSADLINNDLRSIYQLYLENGFLRIKINKPNVKIFKFGSFNKAVIDLNIEEGSQYKVAELMVESADEEELLIPADEFINNMSLKTGEIYSQSKFYKDRSYLEYFYQDRGYAYSTVTVDSQINDEDKTISIKYIIKKEQKVYINRVNIQGNISTRDYVVRRELSLHDSQLYRISKVEESTSRLNQLGYFDQQAGVSFIKKTNLDQSIDYDVKLKETLTGSLNLSVTYNENTGLGLAGQVAKRNFLGRGYSISMKLNTDGHSDHEAQVSLSDPYLFDSKFSSTTSIAYSQYKSEDDQGRSNYHAVTYQIGEALGYPIWANWRIFYKLNWKIINYSQISESGIELLNFIDSHDQRTVGVSINYNTVNHPLFSSRGVKFNLGYDFIGLIPGGNILFDRLNLEYQYFKNLTDNDSVVFMGRYRFIRLFEKDGQVPIPPDSRIAIGGITTIRGFDYGALSGATSYAEIDRSFNILQLKDNNYPLYRYYRLHQDGNLLSLLNLEVLFPLTQDQSNIRGVVFFDAGNVWSEPEMHALTGAKLDYGYYRMSYGGGVRVITPAGVIRLEYANVINPLPRDNSGKLELFIGALF